MFRLVSHVSETFCFYVKIYAWKEGLVLYQKNSTWEDREWSFCLWILNTLQSLPEKYEVFMFELYKSFFGRPALRADFSQGFGEKKENRILVVYAIHDGWGCRPWFLCTFFLPLDTIRLSVKVVFQSFFFQSVFSILLRLSESLQRQCKFLNTEEKLVIWLWCSSGC